MFLNWSFTYVKYTCHDQELGGTDADIDDMIIQLF